jgi:hypothetical protein
MYQADRSALGAIGSPFIMIFPYELNPFILVSICQEADLSGADGNASVLSLKVPIRIRVDP